MKFFQDWEKAIFQSIAVCLLFVCSAALAETIDAQWTWMNPDPSAGTLNGVHYLNGNYYAVGNFGRLSRSDDGNAWSPVSLGTREHLYAVAWNQIRYVIVGESGTIFYSDDGRIWTSVDGVDDHLYDVHSFGSYFYAVGENASGNGVLWRSIDGISWSAVDLPTSVKLNGLTSSEGLMVVVGDGGILISSNNGTTWTVEEVETSSNLTDVVYGLSTFVAVAEQTTGNRIFTSANGSDWTGSEAPSEAEGFKLGDIGFFNSRFIIGAEGGLVVTRVGVGSWQTQTVNSNGAFTSVAAGEEGYVVVGLSGQIYYSADALSGWTAFLSGPIEDVFTLKEANGVFLAAGRNGSILKSANAVDWTEVHSAEEETLYDLAYGDGLWLAVGAEGYLLASSDNGDSWTEQVSPTTEDLLVAVYGSDRFVLGSDEGRSLMSVDGVVWVTGVFEIGQAIRGIAYGASMFVAVGDGGVWTSAAGQIWTERLLEASNAEVLSHVLFLEDTFWLVRTPENGGSGYQLFSSATGISWTGRGSMDEAPLVFGGDANHLVAVTEEGVTYVSSDGDDWETVNSGTNEGLYSMISYKGGFLMAGEFAQFLHLKLDAIDYFTFFQAPNPLRNGWWWNWWFGFYYGINNPFIYHEYHGWLWLNEEASVPGDSLVYYDFQFGWMFALPTNYPWVHSFDRGEWLYYENGTTNPRLFFQSGGAVIEVF